MVETLFAPCLCRTKEGVGEPAVHRQGQQQTASPALPPNPSALGNPAPALCTPQSTAPFPTLHHHRVQSHHEGHSLLSFYPSSLGDSSGCRFPSPKRIAQLRNCRGERTLWNTKQTQLTPDKRGNQEPFCI